MSPVLDMVLSASVIGTLGIPTTSAIVSNLDLAGAIATVLGSGSISPISYVFSSNNSSFVFQIIICSSYSSWSIFFKN